MLKWQNSFWMTFFFNIFLIVLPFTLVDNSRDGIVKGTKDEGIKEEIQNSSFFALQNNYFPTVDDGKLDQQATLLLLLFAPSNYFEKNGTALVSYLWGNKLRKEEHKQRHRRSCWSSFLLFHIYLNTRPQMNWNDRTRCFISWMLGYVGRSGNRHSMAASAKLVDLFISILGWTGITAGSCSLRYNVARTQWWLEYVI